MATGYSITTSEDIANKRWSEALYNDMIFSDGIIKEAEADGVLKIETALNKGAGDKITCSYATRLTDAGILGDASKRANAAAVTYVTDSLYINEYSIVAKAKTKGSITQQMVAFDLSDSAYESVSDAYKQRLITGFFKQAGGELASTLTYDGVSLTGDDRKKFTGIGQLPTAPTTYRKKFATGSTDEAVQAASSATLTLSAISTLYTEAKNQRSGVNNMPVLRGRMWNGLPYEYVFYVSTAGMSQLIADATANQLTLGQIVLSQIQGGKSDAAASVGRAFVYRFVKVVEVPDHYIPNGCHSSTTVTQANVKRAIFCGANAVTLAFGQGYTPQRGDAVPGFSLVSDTDTIEKEVVTSASCVLGVKKNVVNSYDYSTITYSHYVA